MVPRKGMSSGIHLQLKTETGTLPVHLGPAWYIERLDMKIVKGDKLEIKGSRVTFEGKPAIIAAEVAKGDGVLVLRDASGIPAWAGWRKRELRIAGRPQAGPLPDQPLRKPAVHTPGRALPGNAGRNPAPAHPGGCSRSCRRDIPPAGPSRTGSPRHARSPNNGTSS